MGTRMQVAQTILDSGDDYVLAPEQNRPATFAEVEALFAAPPPSLVRSSASSAAIDMYHARCP